MSRCLISGAAGMMGSHLCRTLVKQGHYVVGVDSLDGGFEENIEDLYEHSGTFGFHVQDCAHPESMKYLFDKYEQFDYVFHLAADATEGRSQFTPVYCTTNNFMAHINVLKESIKHNVKRYILFSSMSVYGKQVPPFGEELPRSPVDVYGVNKASMEHTTEILSDVHGFEYVILRPHNVYGIGQRRDDPYRNVVAIWINHCLRKKPFYIYGDGEQQRAFSYIDDIIPCVVKSMTEPVNKEVFNLGARTPYTLNQLAEIVLNEFGNPFKPIHVPDRPREVKHAWATVERSVEKLGFKETVTLVEGVHKMAEWARSKGPQEPDYSVELEIGIDKAPSTWAKKLI